MTPSFQVKGFLARSTIEGSGSKALTWKDDGANLLKECSKLSIMVLSIINKTKEKIARRPCINKSKKFDGL